MASSESKVAETEQQQQPAVEDQKLEQKAAALGEDDEFEDFRDDDWPTGATQGNGEAKHLWEESWDDDDTSDDFSAQLREELKKVEASKKR